jgi:hypothetical protein
MGRGGWTTATDEHARACADALVRFVRSCGCTGNVRAGGAAGRGVWCPVQRVRTCRTLPACHTLHGKPASRPDCAHRVPRTRNSQQGHHSLAAHADLLHRQTRAHGEVGDGPEHARDAQRRYAHTARGEARGGNIAATTGPKMRKPANKTTKGRVAGGCREDGAEGRTDAAGESELYRTVWMGECTQGGCALCAWGSWDAWGAWGEWRARGEQRARVCAG